MRQKLSGYAAPPPPFVPYMLRVPEVGTFVRYDLLKLAMPGTGTPTTLISGATTNSSTAINQLQPDPSPDGTKVVYIRDAGVSPFGLMQVADADGSNNTTIYSGSPDPIPFLPRWSPDSSRILFKVGNFGSQRLRVCDADGTNNTQVYNPGAAFITAFDWSRAGDQIVVALGPGTGGSKIQTLNDDGTGVTTVSTRANVVAVQWGHLSDFLVYQTTLTGGQTYISDVDGSNETVLTTFGSESMSASRRFLARDDSTVYPVYQTGGPGPWQIYKVPTDGSGMSTTGIWTTGNTTGATGRPQCFPGTTRFYVCAYPTSTPVAADNRLVSYAADGTDRFVEDPGVAGSRSLGD